METQKFLDSITLEMVRASCAGGTFMLEDELDNWREEVGRIVSVDPFEPRRGRETLCHYFANLPPEKLEKAVNHKWASRPATEKQIKLIKWRFSIHKMHMVREDISILEASMLLDWVEDFDNLAKKPKFDLDYVM